MCFVFFFQCALSRYLWLLCTDLSLDLDKQSLSFAAVYGLVDDLNLVGTQYSWTSAIFYCGQLAAEFPIIYLMSRLRLSKFVGITMQVPSLSFLTLQLPNTNLRVIA